MDLVDIENYEGLYKFDKDLNQVYSLKTKKYIKNGLNKGYYAVGLYKNGKTKTFRLNYLIYKYNNQYNQDDFVNIDGFEDYKFNKNLNQVININTGKYLTNYVNNTGYYSVNLYKNNKQKGFKLHRLIFKSQNPLINIEELFIDHIDQNKLNNNINNLRIATRSDNNCNRLVQKNNKSTGIKNIYKTEYNTFPVIIKKDGKFYRRTFKSLEEAIIWRDIKLKEIHKEFACYN